MRRKGRQFALPALIGLSMLASACWPPVMPKQHAAAFTPPPPHPRPVVEIAAVRLPPPPSIAGNSHLPPQVTDTIVVSFGDGILPPPEPAPAHHPAPAPARTAAPEPAPAAPPRLEPVYPAQQRRAYIRDLDESLERVRRALEFLSTRNLNAEQAEQREKIATFKRQAEEHRAQNDLGTAVNLAKRADVLAKDLMTSLAP